MDTVTHKIRLLMERNKYLRKMVPFIRERKLVRYMPCFHYNREHIRNIMQRANETREEFSACYETNRDEFARLEEMLADDFSRRTLQAVIAYRLTPNPNWKILKPVIVWPMYFLRDIIKPAANEVFVDGGGYIGDTLLDLAAFWGKNSWKKIYSWEPDVVNREQLIEVCKAQKYRNVEITLRRAGGCITNKNRSIKYVCPHCGTIIRATKQANIICGGCNVAFEQVCSA